MSNNPSELRERFEWPVSTVRPQNVVRKRILSQVEEFEDLALSPQDEGFLRLARVILEPEPIQWLDDEPKSRPGAEWEDDGLFS